MSTAFVNAVIRDLWKQTAQYTSVGALWRSVDLLIIPTLPVLSKTTTNTEEVDYKKETRTEAEQISHFEYQQLFVTSPLGLSCLRPLSNQFLVLGLCIHPESGDTW